MKWNMQNISFPMTRSLQDKIDLSPSFSLEKSDQFMQYFALLVIMLRDLFWFTGHVNYQRLVTMDLGSLPCYTQSRDFGLGLYSKPRSHVRTHNATKMRHFSRVWPA